MNTAAFSIKKPVTTVMIFISMLLIGAISSRLLPLEYFPDISFPGAFIELPYPNSTPEEVEQRIARPVEEALATIPGIKYMNSRSEENNAGVFIRFAMDADMDRKIIQIQEKLDGIRNTLPEDFERYFVRKFSAQDEPVLNLRISGNTDLSTAYDLLFHSVKQPLERIEGVSKVELYGVEKKQIRIEVLPERLKQYKIDIQQVISVLRSENIALSAGKVTMNGLRYMIRPTGELKSTEQIKSLVINSGGLRLQDVANVSYQLPKIDYGRHLDMKYAIGLDVYKESGANTVKVVELVDKEVERIKQIPEMSGIILYEMNNQGNGIVSSLSDLLQSGIIGGLFSVIILFVFLRSVSTTLMVALAVPFSLTVTLGCMYFMGYTLNILSMMGLMLAVGMLVDNAVVVTENIHRHLQILREKTDSPTKLERIKAIIEAVREVGIAVTAGTLTSIIVFLPNIVNQGDMVAIYLEHVSVSIIISLVASLLISLTLIPLISSRLKNLSTGENARWFNRFSNWYEKVLNWLTDHRYTSVALLIGVIVLSFIPIQFVKTNMFDDEEGRQIRLFYNLNGNYTVEKVKEAVLEIEKYLYANQEKFEIESVYSYYNTGFATSTIKLLEDDFSKDVSVIKEEIRKDLPPIAIGSPVFDWRSMMGNEQLKVYVIGESTQELKRLADEAARRLSSIDGLTDVRSEAENGSQEIRIVVDREKAASVGMNTQQVATMVSASLRGQQMRKVKLEFSEVDVLVSYPDADRQSLEDIRTLSMNKNGGQEIPLMSIAAIESGGSPRQIFRENRVTSLGIVANLSGKTRDEINPILKQVMDQINYPSGYGWSFATSFQNGEEAMNSMLFNMLLALILIYMVMAALFESLLYPLSIITSILFAVFGVYWFFAITQTTFSLMAMIGILILMGIVVNNGIVLIDHINQLRTEGFDRKTAISTAGKNRIRPILMTVGTTVLGLIPLSIGGTQIGGDGPPYFPMARAIIGGLIFSTFVTLVLLPTIYILLDDLKTWAVLIMNPNLENQEKA